eukprot:3948083-Alexandrium_andersonii.AAC.1
MQLHSCLCGVHSQFAQASCSGMAAAKRRPCVDISTADLAALLEPFVCSENWITYGPWGCKLDATRILKARPIWQAVRKSLGPELVFKQSTVE